MTAARFVDSLRHGGKLVGFLLVILLVGGAAVVGGAALAVPARLDLAAGSVSTARRVGGVALASVGALAVLVGLVAFVHKLVADAVATGVAHGAPEPPSPTAGGADDTVADDRSSPGASDRVDGETDAEEWFDDSAPEPETGDTGAATESEMTPIEGDASPEDTQRPAPSPAEIAFGSEGDTHEGESKPDAPEDPNGGVGASEGPATGDAGPVVSENPGSDDPLADRGEE